MNELIEFAKEQCEIFPEYTNMGMYLRETLKMLQTEPCEDAVSRADAKKSKWVIKYYGFPPEPSTVCSNCGYDIDFEVSKLVKANAFAIEPYRPNYCPNCGAEMESKE